MEIYFTVLKPGDTVVGPNLSPGGHLTAGSPVNYSGKLYSIVAYGVRKDTELIDLDEVRDLAKTHRPKRSEEHTSELQSRPHLVCRLLLEKKKKEPEQKNR